MTSCSEKTIAPLFILSMFVGLGCCCVVCSSGVAEVLPDACGEACMVPCAVAEAVVRRTVNTASFRIGISKWTDGFLLQWAFSE